MAKPDMSRLNARQLPVNRPQLPNLPISKHPVLMEGKLRIHWGISRGVLIRWLSMKSKLVRAHSNSLSANPVVRTQRTMETPCSHRFVPFKAVFWLWM